jgi:hypothetical protein
MGSLFIAGLVWGKYRKSIMRRFNWKEMQGEDESGQQHAA